MEGLRWREKRVDMFKVMKRIFIARGFESQTSFKLTNETVSGG